MQRRIWTSTIVVSAGLILLPLVCGSSGDGGESSGSSRPAGNVAGSGHTTSKELTVDLGGGVKKMDLVLIPAGEFMMGSNDCDSNEKPVHRVKISKPFYMGKYEVTQAQWEAVMGNTPSFFKGDGNLPVENITWDDCQEFCRKLTQRAGMTLRIPTEAEWEYACRAGSRARFGFGDSDGQLGEYAWYYDNSGNKTHLIGHKKPNAYGLYDMHGNVAEWCQDWKADYYSGTQVDPAGPSSGGLRVVRGGSWYSGPRLCRLAARDWSDPDFRYRDHGFRVVGDVGGAAGSLEMFGPEGRPSR